MNWPNFSTFSFKTSLWQKRKIKTTKTDLQIQYSIARISDTPYHARSWFRSLIHLHAAGQPLLPVTAGRPLFPVSFHDGKNFIKSTISPSSLKPFSSLTFKSSSNGSEFLDVMIERSVRQTITVDFNGSDGKISNQSESVWRSIWWYRNFIDGKLAPHM